MLFLPSLHHAPTPMLVKPSPQPHMSSYAMMLSRPPSSNPTMARTKCSSVSPSILPLILKGVRTLCLSTALNRPTSTARPTSFHHPPPPLLHRAPKSATVLPPHLHYYTELPRVRYSAAPTPPPHLHYYTELPRVRYSAAPTPSPSPPLLHRAPKSPLQCCPHPLPHPPLLHRAPKSPLQCCPHPPPPLLHRAPKSATVLPPLPLPHPTLLHRAPKNPLQCCPHPLPPPPTSTTTQSSQESYSAASHNQVRTLCSLAEAPYQLCSITLALEGE